MPTDLRLSPPPFEWGVQVVEEAVSSAALEWGTKSFPPPRFDYPGPPGSLRDEPWFDYCVLAVSVLACLWPPPGATMWSVTRRERTLTDAPALFAAITDWMEPDGLPDLGRFASITATDSRRLFAGEGVLQMVPQRGVRLAAVACALLDRWDGAAVNLVEEAGWNGPTVVDLLASTVPGYEDEATVGGHHIRFRKLAHLAAAVMASRSKRRWSGMDSFGVYPDYMLPRFLRHLGVLSYSEALSESVDNRIEIPRHSRQEVAIRWATVHAGHRLVESIRWVGKPICGPRLDYFLWSKAVLGPDAHRMGEHHRTRTLDY
ncbi:MAG: hypothetical protein J4G00_05215 [Actinomycetia bacterium]|nr:hypothetical protein [Actinomycetes bacterium]